MARHKQGREMTTIDLNCDMGESYGRWTLGDDEAIMPFISSASVACGGHAGDPSVMLRTVRLAKARNVAVGAHPGYPDLQGFGRRTMSLSADEVLAMLLYQIGALAAIARSEGVELNHVKPHGALYNQACADRSLAEAVAGGARRFSRELPLFGLPGTYLERAASDAGLRFVAEGFMDRAYEPSGQLRARTEPGAVHRDPAVAAEQAVSLARGEVRAWDGTLLRLSVQTICVHGDSPGATAIARAAKEALTGAGVAVQRVSG